MCGTSGRALGDSSVTRGGTTWLPVFRRQETHLAFLGGKEKEYSLLQSLAGENLGDHGKDALLVQRPCWCWSPAELLTL